MRKCEADFALMKTICGVGTLHNELGSCLLTNNVVGEQRKQVTTWLSKSAYYSHHREMEARVLRDTGRWFQSSEKFKAWTESDECALLWLRGNGMPLLIQQILCRIPIDCAI